MDTYYITKIYMMRPVSCIGHSLGQWFCDATGIDDDKLAKDGSSFSAKEYIIEQGFNQMPNLEMILREHNKSLSMARSTV